MPDIEPHRRMLPEERRSWERWQKRGRRRYVQFLTAILVGCVVLLSVVFSFLPDFGLMEAIMMLFAGITFGVPTTLFFGNMLWDDMERRYEASRDYNPPPAEEAKHKSDVYFNLLILAPLAAFGLFVVLPEPFPSLAFLWIGSIPFFVIGIAFKTGKWWLSRRPVPVSSRQAIAGMIYCAILGILVEGFWLYVLWGASRE